MLVARFAGLMIAIGSVCSMGLGGQAATASQADRQPRVIVREAIVAAPRAAVWEAWTTSEGAQTFFAPDARIELRRGGAYEIHFVPSAEPGMRGSEGCRVVDFEPRERLMFTWNAPPKFPELRKHRTIVVVCFSDAGEGKTKVTIQHMGWGAGEQWNEVFGYFERAWPHVLGNLQKRFDSGPIQWPASTAPEELPGAKKQHFVYFLRPSRPGFFDGATEEEKRLVGKHAAYLRRLTESGTVILAGPCYGEPTYPDPQRCTRAINLEMPTPGIVVFEAADMDAAQRIMEGDPAVAAGVFKARLNAFNLALIRE